ncbi:MAG: prepilin-type N-terminal cleavage/methylation domain-containing protein [Hylemonella sp.]|uniref:PulJ/GspJ family protein n=1 Tax=Hylemonella sp. TaxID=2066020 RepID=UPI0022C5DB3F|nr:prepilin-type N-terminal cleavage/methylation domain-containing protein [Hylemonella sp.]MCZ8252330.1 prepilin-type N-terminal cleavage/methylation domain-containing protein [Hylemonella sp.]
MRRDRKAGFTLVELLVALSIMALMTLMSWRGLDGMWRVQGQTRERSDALLTLQTGLAQWNADLDALVSLPTPAGAAADAPRSLDWNGQVLRMTRESAAPAPAGWRVVAWTQREEAGQGKWLRWQSGVLRTRGEWQTAWLQAALWAQSPGAETRRDEVQITGLTRWQIYYYRDNSWSHPLSSATAGSPATPSAGSAVPEGVRLVLSLPPGPAVTGEVTRDWARPTLAGHRS